jgi:hypothetical protein
MFNILRNTFKRSVRFVSKKGINLSGLTKGALVASSFGAM